MEDQQALPPHLLVFPLPFQGPVNSMFKLAELLCVSGFHITFLVTEHIHRRLLRNSDIQSHLNRYPGLRFETISDGLPEDHPRSVVQLPELFDSLKTITKPLLREMLTSGRLRADKRRPVSCIIADGLLGFSCDIAKETGIPIFYTRTLSPCCLWIYLSLPKLIDSGDLHFKGNDLDTPIKSVPGMEDFLRRRDFPSFSRSINLLEDDPVIKLGMNESQENPRAYGLILNTFEDLDGSILSHIRTVCPNIYPIGPLHAHLKSRHADQTGQSSTSSNSLWEEDRSCMAWLDAQPPKSVIYVSFGSLATMTRDQLMEFWHGLLNSGHRFLWVIRPDIVAGRGSEHQVPPELSEGTKERGYIVGWAPQQEVLAHPAVGSFLTHSGWNSTLESIAAGVPMICWPYFVDQMINSRFMEVVWKLGLDMKDSCDRVTIEKMIRDLMEVRKHEFLQRADHMATLVRKTVSEGGSSYSNFDRLIEDIRLMSVP